MTTPVQHAPTTPRFCRKCDYNLVATEGPVCPECGRAFSPNDPRTFDRLPRHSLRGRWRRWKWFIVPAFLLIALWPKGWLRTRVTWTDPVTKGSVFTDNLLIGHPWWLGGWYPPIGRSSQTGGPEFAAPTTLDLPLTLDLWRCDSLLPWRYDNVGQGTLSVPAPAPPGPLTPKEWTDMIRAYTRTAADATSTESGPMSGMVIRYTVPAWENTHDR